MTNKNKNDDTIYFRTYSPEDFEKDSIWILVPNYLAQEKVQLKFLSELFDRIRTTGEYSDGGEYSTYSTFQNFEDKSSIQIHKILSAQKEERKKNITLKTLKICIDLKTKQPIKGSKSVLSISSRGTIRNSDLLVPFQDFLNDTINELENQKIFIAQLSNSVSELHASDNLYTKFDELLEEEEFFEAISLITNENLDISVNKIKASVAFEKFGKFLVSTNTKFLQETIQENIRLLKEKLLIS